MFAKCLAAVLLCSMLIGFSHQQVVVPSYAAAYYPSAYAYPSVYSPYLTAAAYPSVWAWGSNKNKNDAPGAPATASLANNRPTRSSIFKQGRDRPNFGNKPIAMITEAAGQECAPCDASGGTCVYDGPNTHTPKCLQIVEMAVVKALQEPSSILLSIIIHMLIQIGLTLIIQIVLYTWSAPIRDFVAPLFNLIWSWIRSKDKGKETAEEIREEFVDKDPDLVNIDASSEPFESFTVFSDVKPPVAPKHEDLHDDDEPQDTNADLENVRMWLMA